MKNKVTCDNCNKEFELNILEDNIKEDISKVYFTCSHCDKEYISHYTDKVIRVKQKKMKGLVNKLGKLKGKKDFKQSEKLYKQYLKIQEELKRDMDNLKEEVETIC